MLTVRESLDDIVARRVEFLTGYQNAAYAQQYSRFVERVRAAEAPLGKSTLSEAVARNLFKLMAYKDEYEVARLYSDGSFLQQLQAQFAGDYRLQFHLAPSWLTKADPVTGAPRKRQFGPWMLKAFALLAKFKFLRGTALDPFGYGAERQLERELIEEYERSVEYLLAELKPGNYRTAVALAELPEQIRGYGHVKEQAVAKVREQGRQLKARLLASEIQAVQLFEPAA